MIAAALRGVLSDRARDGRLFIVDTIIDGDLPNTKQALQAVAAIGEYRTAIVVLHREEDIAWLSLRNVPTVHAIAVDQLNTYDVLVNQTVVFTQAALGDYLARYGVTAAAPKAAKAEPKAQKAEAEEATKAVKPAEADDAEATKAVKKDEAAEATKAVKKAEAEPKAEAKAEAKPEPKVEAKAEPKTLKAEPAAPAEADDAHPYGAGSYAGPKPPKGYDIKGNADSMKFHTPESPFYERTIAEVWFDSVEAAEAAGFAPVQGDDGAADEEETK
jgi:large subunit ribosomal protein L4